MGKDSKLNVLMMVSWYSEIGTSINSGIFHYELVNRLNKYCNCAIYYPYDRFISEDVYSGDNWGIKTYRSRYALEKKVRNRINMIKAMRMIMKEFNPDIIHGNVATEAGRFAIILGKMFSIPVIITEHSAVEASGVTEFPHYFYARNVYSHSLYNACVSDCLTQNLKKIFPKYNFYTVYNGIMEPENIEFTHHKYRVDEVVNIAVVADFYDEKIKGFHILFPVIKRLVEQKYKIVFHFVGDGEYLSVYKKLSKEFHLEEQCIFYGRCPKGKVYDIVSQVDFMLSASLFESFGCSIAEGMMLGKPAVVTRCGGLESIVNENTGILVEKDDADELYGGIVRMLNHYKEYSPDMLKTYAYNKFSLEHIAQKYINIYKEILNR